MKRGLIAAGAVAMLLLTGCTAAQEPATSDATVSTDAVAGAAAPLAAETPDADSSEDPSTPEAAFLAAVHEARAGKILSTKTQIPNATDAQLLDAGRTACVLLADGQTLETITVIDGETPDSAGYFIDSSAIARAAAKSLCP